MISSWSTHIEQSLAVHEAKQLKRVRRQLQSSQGARIVIDGETLTNFSSNDYLGLANHPVIVESFIESAKTYGVGVGASHLVCGHHQAHDELEQLLAEWTGRERALVFSSGYMANLGVLQALLSEADFVVADKLNHASLIDGMLASSLRPQRYKHRDADDLERLLEKSRSQSKANVSKGVVVTDSIFSMDGDIADLAQLSKLAKQHNSLLMVDDAHGLGVLGETGAGCVEAFDLSQNDVPVLIGTFGKALGCSGAFVAGSDELIEWVIQKSRNYIYTTAMPPALTSAIAASVRLVQSAADLREHLSNLISYFKSRISSYQFSDKTPPQINSDTAIQPIIIGDSAVTMQLGAALRSKGFLVATIRPPTVPVNTARLRVSLSAAHSLSNIESLLDAFEYEARQLGVLV